jgi:2-keto-4-pentenoate hydratase/2-oxohepta-3-ene-1,7-dioic acid hydratase in catechol pathway
VRFYRLDTASGPQWAREEAARLRFLEGSPFDGWRDRGDHVPLEGARLLVPTTPSKIVAVGLNYRDHAAETGRPTPAEPLLFLKPTTALLPPGGTIRKPAWAGRVDHEAEVGLVIGRTAVDVPSEEEARAHILGAVCVNDVTARQIQRQDVQFTRGKGFDTFCPVGPCLSTGLDLGALRLEGRVNGQVRQRGHTSALLFSCEFLVMFVSRVMTLLPGDIITTGTPAGIGPLEVGDEVEVEVEGVGVLHNTVGVREA